jgi:hypothetical protein
MSEYTYTPPYHGEPTPLAEQLDYCCYTQREVDFVCRGLASTEGGRACDWTYLVAVLHCLREKVKSEKAAEEKDSASKDEADKARSNKKRKM